MTIEHVALWSHDIEKLKHFYCHYFGGTASVKYENPAKAFQSYFISFSNGTRLEIMQSPNVSEDRTGGLGLAHLAFATGSKQIVDDLTHKLQQEGFTVISPCRTTGDGYYESCIQDPEGNLIEITI